MNDIVVIVDPPRILFAAFANKIAMRNFFFLERKYIALLILIKTFKYYYVLHCFSYTKSCR